MSTVGIFLFGSLGASCLAISHVDHFDLELLETAPLGGKSQIFVRGSAENMLKFQKSLRVSDLLRSKIINNCDQRTLDTYFHLYHGQIQEELFVFEADFSGDLMEICNQGLRLEMNPVEMRFPRFQGAKINLLMNGKSTQKTHAWLKELGRQRISFHHIKQPGKTLKGLFQFEVSK